MNNNNGESGKTQNSDRDYIYYDSTALLKEETVDQYLKDYASEYSPKYAQAYITRMSPDTFLKLTTGGISGKLQIEL